MARISSGLLLMIPLWWFSSALFRPESFFVRFVIGSLIMLIAVAIKATWSKLIKPKKLVLFLRKFNSTELNKTISSLSQSQFSNRYRLVTLDDSDFESTGIRKSQHLLIFAFLFVLIVGLGMLASILLLLYFSNQATAEGEAYFYMRLLTIAAILLPLVFTLIVTITYNFVVYRIAILRENISVQNGKGFSLALKTVQRLKTKRFASKSRGAISTLIGTSDNYWKKCIQMLARESDLIILDSSVLSESIKWEIETIDIEYPQKLILLAKSEQFQENKSELNPRITKKINVYRDEAELKSLLLESLSESDSIGFQRDVPHGVRL